MNFDRRQFLQHSAVACAVTGISLSKLPQSSASQSNADGPIIDTHQHLWDLDRFRLPWLSDAPAVLNRSYVMDDYLEATRGLNVTKAVYMEVDVEPSQQTAEAELLLELCRRGNTPTVGAVISGRPNSDDFETYITQFKDQKAIKGVRQVLHTASAARGLCLERQFVRSMQLLGNLGMSFDLCMRPTELADGVKLAERALDTRFIVDHCGNADPKAFFKSASADAPPLHDADAWRRDIEALAKRDNVVCKISGIVARAPQGWDAATLAPVVNRCLDAFGADRVVFGGDWPVCKLGASFREWVAALKQIIADRPAEHQRKLLHDNAARLYKLT